MDFFDIPDNQQHGRRHSKDYSATRSPHTDDLAIHSPMVAAPPPSSPPPFHFQHHNQPSTPTPTPPHTSISSFISPDSIKGAIGKIEALKAANHQLTLQKDSLSNELAYLRQTCANLRRSLFEMQGDNTLLSARVAKWEEYSEGYLSPILAAFQDVRRKHYHSLRAKIRSVDAKFQTAKKELLHDVQEERQKSAETTQLMLKELLKEKDAFIADLQRRNATLTSELATSFMGTPASSSGGGVGGGGRSTSGATTPIRSASSAFPSGRVASSSVSSSRPPHHHSTTPPQPSRGTPRGAFSLPTTVVVDNHHQQPLSRPSYSNNGSFATGHDSAAASPSARQNTSPTQVVVPPSPSSSSHHYTVQPHHHHTTTGAALAASSTNLATSTSGGGEFRLSRRPSGNIKNDAPPETMMSSRHSGSQSLLDSAMLGAVGVGAASPSPIRVVEGADRGTNNDSSRWGDLQLSPSTARIMERLSMVPPR